MLESGFELINLADTIAPLSELAAPESSDDGLDPVDFLSQSHHHSPPHPRASTLSPVEVERLELTPTGLRTQDPSGKGASTPLSRASSAHDSVFASASTLGDSLGPESFVFLHRPVSTDATQNPLVFLQTQQDALGAELRRHMRQHMAMLAAGDDCGPVRAALAQDWARLLETCVLLHEACVREQAVVEALLVDFETWDRRRTKVLRHIQLIKSDSSKYGTKLAGLLHRRLEVDREVEALESRIAALKAQRIVITREISETSSVLESKSAKYVNMFRDLERKGRDLITDYLSSAGVRGHDLQLLLRSEPVDATFSMAQKLPTTVSDASPRAPQLHSPLAVRRPSALPQTSPSRVSPTPASMGTQPLHAPVSLPAPQMSPYAQGYASGSHHLERLKQGINGFVHGIARPPEHPVAREKVDDILNTITEKINVSPILDILRHKIEALEDMSLKTSRLSAVYNNQYTAWNDVCKQLESQEKLLLLLLNDRNTHPDQLVERLKVTLDVLTQELEKVTSAHILSATPKENSLGIVIHQELKAVASAIDLLVGGNSNLQAVESLVNDSTAPKLSRERLSMRITSAGYHPSPTPTIMTARVNTSTIQDSVFAPRLKNMKSE